MQPIDNPEREIVQCNPVLTSFARAVLLISQIETNYLRGTQLQISQTRVFRETDLLGCLQERLHLMANLQDLCLSALERTGADVQSVLGNLKEILPERYLARHPVVIITGDSLESGDDDSLIEKKIKLTVQYTGVYHLSIEESFSDLPEELLVEETYVTIDSLVKRILGLMQDGVNEIILYNPVKQRKLFDIGTYDDYSAGRYNYRDEMKKTLKRLRDVLESLPDYIHI